MIEVELITLTNNIQIGGLMINETIIFYMSTIFMNLMVLTEKKIIENVCISVLR
jgi:hypothetical protein